MTLEEEMEDVDKRIEEGEGTLVIKDDELAGEKITEVDILVEVAFRVDIIGVLHRVQLDV